MDDRADAGLVDEVVRGQVGRVLNSTPLTDVERESVIDGIRRCYEAAGHEWHGTVVWVSSPREGALAASMIGAWLQAHPDGSTAGVRAVVTDVFGRLRAVVARTPASVVLAAGLAVLTWVVLRWAGPVVAAFAAWWEAAGWQVIGLGLVVGVLAGVVIAFLLAFRWVDRLNVFGFPDFWTTAGLWLLVVLNAPVLGVVGVAVAVRLCGVGDMVGPGIPFVVAALTGPLLVTASCELRLWQNGWRDRRQAALMALRRGPYQSILARLSLLRACVVTVVGAETVRDLVSAVSGPVAEAEHSVRQVITSAAGGWGPRRVHRRAARAVAVDALQKMTGRRVRGLAWLDPVIVGERAAARFLGQFGRSDLAWQLWLRNRGDGSVTTSLANELDTHDRANRAGPWWPCERFTVVSERPVELHIEQAGTTRRPHRIDGPAVRWRDGFALCFWRGTPVPQRFLTEEWSVREIHRERNSEVRRAAIERVGWAEFVRRARWRRIATVNDPGNHPHQLILYEDPRHRFGSVRVLVMTNGSPDRSGARRDYAELVPGYLNDPIEAAAWQYDCPVEVYRQLARRT